MGCMRTWRPFVDDHVQFCVNYRLHLSQILIRSKSWGVFELEIIFFGGWECNFWTSGTFPYFDSCPVHHYHIMVMKQQFNLQNIAAIPVTCWVLVETIRVATMKKCTVLQLILFVIHWLERDDVTAVSGSKDATTKSSWWLPLFLAGRHMKLILHCRLVYWCFIIDWDPRSE